ncbi:MAG: MerR family transcriptional regulator [Anaerolineae bacterium]|jgi:MerR family transcriptional regulator/heat shock protein HspR
MDDDLAVYIISSAAELLGLHPRTLHLYEAKGLIVPERKGNRRFYSDGDLAWVRALRYLVHERGLNLEGLRQLLALKAQEVYGQGGAGLPAACEVLIGPRAPCWEEGMAVQACRECPVYGAAREGLVADQGIPQVSP